MKIGTLVKVTNESLSGDIVFGWYRIENALRAHIFEEGAVHGIFLGKSTVSNNTIWYDVLVGTRIFLFTIHQLEAHGPNDDI